MPTKVDLLQLTYTLTFSTLFHCGTGERTGLIDRSVIRDDEGYLYVPGSTFKGTLREICEQLARLYDPAMDQENTAPWGSVAPPHDTAAPLMDLTPEPHPSMVTRIFGSQSVPGRLFFDDARLREEDQRKYERAQDAGTPDRRAGRRDYKGLQVNIYTQVRLDRPTRTFVPGALFTSEFGTNDLTFNGSIQGWLECTPIEAAPQNERHPGETPTYSLLLLLAGLRMIERLGGNKSSGKGECRCEIEELKLNGHRIETERWLSWLDYLHELANYYETGRAGA
jgi:CRISPR/Cas system CMR subunit Cmr4 (Cas7 group RAMP superfamily)